MRKTWQQKFEYPKKEQIKMLDKNFADMKAGETMLISTPKKITEYINGIPKYENRSLSIMRKDLAKAAGADKTCPLTTGIFTRIVSERSLELMAEGKKPLAPFWKVIEPNSSLANKLSCSPQLIAKLRTKKELH